MNEDRLMDAIGMIDEGIIADARSSGARIKTISRSSRFVIALAAALVMLFGASLSAVAAGSDAVYQILYGFSPSVAQMVKPVNKSCTDNGIRMEVISADIIGSEAYIYISMEDITGDRVDSTIDLFDAYDINRNFDCAAGCERVSFDEETGKALFLIHMQSMDGKDIRRGKITFSVWKFLSRKNVINELLPVDLLSADEKAQTQKVSPDLFRGEAYYGELLAPQDGGVYTPGDGAQITAMGYIDGKFHIQIRYDDMWRTDNHGWLSLEDASGNTLACEEYQFWAGEQKEYTSYREVFQGHEDFYQEFVWDVTPEELARCSLRAELWLCDTLVEGDWQVTFPLSE